MNDVIDFSPNDYFSPSNFDYKARCKDRKTINCSSINLKNSGSCINDALCLNYEYKMGMMDTNSLISETKGRYMDSYSKHNKTMLQTANLTVGIVGLILVIYMYK
uniref:Uncharacterized protein n=1 Tax=viral metagenome TaxID=1070528 RepID=A0A6C0I5Y0_9ZZZZ